MIQRKALDTSGYSGNCDDCYILARHGRDKPQLTQVLDQPLQEESLPEVRCLADEIVDLYKQQLAGIFSGVRIYHSPRLRASQTANLIFETCVTNLVDTEMVEASALREMGQGEFIIRNNVDSEDYPPLVNAWLAFRKKLSLGHLSYRFGDPILKEDGSAEYPQLLGHFTKYGESQIGFSLRLYRFLHDFLYIRDQRIPIIVAHQATASRIQRIFSVLKAVDETNLPAAGDLVCQLERRGVRASINHACGIVASRPKLNPASKIIEREIQYLESTQRPNND
ncbi:MAG: hypothetical protein A3J47_00520 [Candidatus Yanofskybacteria bacterium RIFCSPHIGHO2_02_FULL_43_22]|uniref:Uncharacterized protein n=1 Tax=Candidatus Yanofskybacteria bacterium RIFCSPHIGHO2_02_FULL_43_22 TaxID=1802681 RepID=A0A1F8FPS4_9BACT|nr:MAG: hypothetical protein A3J47_00520 [Candidatus Yanofskybacteria bacterium RIFCSPHIGHO2_02_FULL_43_22]